MPCIFLLQFGEKFEIARENRPGDRKYCSGYREDFSLSDCKMSKEPGKKFEISKSSR